MCVVSNAYDYYSQPTYVPFPWPTAAPTTLPWTRGSFGDLKEILVKLDALDKKLGLEHCEDPKKAEWMKSIEKRLQSLEAAK